jgi:hypothetical protein
VGEVNVEDAVPFGDEELTGPGDSGVDTIPEAPGSPELEDAVSVPAALAVGVADIKTELVRVPISPVVVTVAVATATPSEL